jgi:hypothetical protein
MAKTENQSTKNKINIKKEKKQKSQWHYTALIST